MRSLPFTVRCLLLISASGAVGCSRHTAYRAADQAPDTQALDASGRSQARPAYRLLLVGDAGYADRTDMNLATVRQWRTPGHSLVVFLGDNAYPEGFTEANQSDAEEQVATLLDSVGGTRDSTLFIPGNHDWARGQEEGQHAVIAEESFVEQYARFLPSKGCPGPDYLDLPADGPVLRLIALDTQWWLHANDKPIAGCVAGAPDEIVAALEQALDTRLPVVVVSHHPLQSHGIHGGFRDWHAHLFPLPSPLSWVPLPAVGSAYLLAKRHLHPDPQDFASEPYQRMRDRLEAALATRHQTAPLLHVAGHDHSLQVLKGRAVDYAIVSGAGSDGHTSPVTDGPDTLFAHQHAGFVVIDLTGAGLDLHVVEPTDPGADPESSSAGQVVFELHLPRPDTDH